MFQARFFLAVAVVATAAAFLTAPAFASAQKCGEGQSVNAQGYCSPIKAGTKGTKTVLGTSSQKGTLPFTGAQLGILALIAVGLVGGGVALHATGRRGNSKQ